MIYEGDTVATAIHFKEEYGWGVRFYTDLFFVLAQFKQYILVNIFRKSTPCVIAGVTLECLVGYQPWHRFLWHIQFVQYITINVLDENYPVLYHKGTHTNKRTNWQRFWRKRGVIEIALSLLELCSSMMEYIWKVYTQGTNQLSHWNHTPSYRKKITTLPD